MRKLIIALTALVAFASCSSNHSGQRVATGTKKVRLHVMFRSTSDHLYYDLGDPVQVKYVDTLYKTGDIITLGTITYKIVD